MASERWVLVLGALAEGVLALAVAMGVTLLLTVPFVPLGIQAELPLRPLAEPSAPRVSQEQLVREVEALGLARHVEIVLKDGASHLVLSGTSGVQDADDLEPVSMILEQGGYRGRGFILTPVFNLESLIGGDPTVLPAMLTLQAGVFLAGGLLLIRLRVRRERPQPAGPWRATGLGLAAGAVVLAISFLLSQALNAIGLPVQEQAWVQEMLARPSRVLLLVPWIVFIGPLSEEVFFRGYLFRLIRQHAGFPAGLIVSSVMFAAIHFNLSGFLIYLLIGCVLGAVYERSATLWTPVVGHMTANGLVLLLSWMVSHG